MATPVQRLKQFDLLFCQWPHKHFQETWWCRKLGKNNKAAAENEQTWWSLCLIYSQIRQLRKQPMPWAVGRVSQCRASSRMRMRYNSYCTQCPSSDIHLRLAFPLAVCINSIRKPLATQTIHFKAHPNVTHDLTDNTCLVRGKRIAYISNMEVLAVKPLPFLRLAAPVQSCTRDLQAAQPASLLKPWYW